MLSRFRRVLGNQLRALRKRRMVRAGGAPSTWYDDVYGGANDYRGHYSESRYLTVWTEIGDRITPGASVLEIGCGPGQCARLLLDRGVLSSYVGFDFSRTAVELARSNVGESLVVVADARTTELFDTVPYDTVLCTEVLEHITDDLAILARIRAGVRVLATVPNFDYESHVRYFTSPADVRQRYGHLFELLDVTTCPHAGDPSGKRGLFFLLDGRKR